jgi:poly(A) polymerase
MPFSGADAVALGIPAGPRVGRLLDAFEKWWIAAGFPNDVELLQTRFAALAKEI